MRKEKNIFREMVPEDRVNLPVVEVIEQLYSLYGEQMELAMDERNTIPSPIAHFTDTNWIKTANTVGINVRTIGSFFRIIPYALGLPLTQANIHILPIWEPGVVASLYGMASWEINPAFFDAELAEIAPHLDTVEKQLKVTINLLHMMGKTVGMDVVPHTDRYSEMALANPKYFEWLKRDDLTIIDHGKHLYKEVEGIIWYFLQEAGSATKMDIPAGVDALFAEGYPEKERLKLIFGAPHDYHTRLERRKAIIHLLYHAGLETVPATMGPPYRGLDVNPSAQAVNIDEDGLIWRDYQITEPQAMSRVFGPLSRYKLYESKDQPIGTWALNFEQPVQKAWAYVAEHYQEVAMTYGFDFMRGDMSHVQMRPEGVPVVVPDYYDLLRYVKEAILKKRPWFAYFAESFLAPPNEMAYGDECDHLEASLADSTLGDLQSEVAGSPTFFQIFRRYIDLLHTRSFAPNFAMMTADKDDPRFDRFYWTGSEIRYFIGLFLMEMPSYMSLGFESRELHHVPAPNERYTKLYVFQVNQGEKAVKGPYQWGKNLELARRINQMAKWADEHDSYLNTHAKTIWHLLPDPTGKEHWFIWQQGVYLFVCYLNPEKNARFLDLEIPMQWSEIVLSTHPDQSRCVIKVENGKNMLSAIAPNEAIILKSDENLIIRS